MNESEIKINITLNHFESLIEDHSTYLDELENISVIPELDYERLLRILKRMRRVRRDLHSGIKTILENIDQTQNKQLKEEAIGIVSYLNLIGFKDEKEILQNLNNEAKKFGYELNIDEDIKQIDEILSLISKISL
ncbi:hypothetical protein DFR86_05925 [Acidianus sulfidivorans JP7]|uniref:Uncharacterized protein n=1 Tax=Acidianus sulfidivorans JP7 TaxID=619593 RepID=A0A2U9IM99_9CREN|nr:hypothetical protein [Acidianus sulfidivorans]AWR97142.1 hypothetical protein DFR86_05925 [Acidianus sulfidivorans JP7]